MIKTSAGNTTLSFTEFKETIEQILCDLGSPMVYQDKTIAFSTLVRAYADLRSRGYFTKIHNAYEWGYQQTLQNYTDLEEAKKHWAVLYVPYNYDVGPGDFVPQDMPHTHLAIDLADGEVIIAEALKRSIYYYVDSARKEEAQKQNEQENN